MPSVKNGAFQIKHKLNEGREYRIGPFVVDGICLETNTVFAFYGCLFYMHNPEICPVTAKLKDKKSAAKFAKARDRTRKRAVYLRSKGYEVVDHWECPDPGDLSSKSYLPPSCTQWLNKNVTDSQLLAAVRQEQFLAW